MDQKDCGFARLDCICSVEWLWLVGKGKLAVEAPGIVGSVGWTSLNQGVGRTSDDADSQGDTMLHLKRIITILVSV